MKDITIQNGDCKSAGTDKELFLVLMAVVVLPLLFISELKAQATNQFITSNQEILYVPTL